MNYQYDYRYKENHQTPKKSNPAKSYYREERDSLKKINDDKSLLISNFPDKYYKQVITEFSKFGNIKNIFYDNRKLRDCMIIEYEDPEIALSVAKIIHAEFLQKYGIHDKVIINLLSEEKKLIYLEEMLVSSETELNTSNFNPNLKSSFAPIKNSNEYNRGFLRIEKQKSNWKKFLDVFFNL